MVQGLILVQGLELVASETVPPQKTKPTEQSSPWVPACLLRGRQLPPRRVELSCVSLWQLLH